MLLTAGSFSIGVDAVIVSAGRDPDVANSAQARRPLEYKRSVWRRKMGSTGTLMRNWHTDERTMTSGWS